MPVVRFSIAVFLLAVLFSCNDQRPGNATTKVEQQEERNIVPDTLSEDTFKQDHPLNPEKFEQVNTLNGGFLLVRSLELKGKFSASRAMQLLFPGNGYRVTEGSDTGLMITWKCPSCRNTEVPVSGINSEEAQTITFPSGVSWDTRPLLPIKTLVDGKEAYVLPFYSTPLVGLEHSGRFNAPVFGTAVFFKDKNSWILKDFQPGLAAVGSFGHSPQPEKMQGSETLVLKQKNSNGPAGGPFLEEHLIYGWVNGHMLLLTEIFPTARVYNGLSDWESSFSLLKDKAGLPVLEVTSEGSLNRSNLEDWERVVLPSALKDAAEKQDQFNFILRVKYRLENKIYQVYDQQMETFPYKPGGEVQ